jgi:hypothetical protein
MPEMIGYEALNLPLTRCVHFVKNREIDGSEERVIEAATQEGVKCIYWNYLDGGSGSTTIADPLGRALELKHAPYGRVPWIEFLDDLITLAYRYSGLVIIVDRADILLRERPDDMFDLIEAFLIQFHHWYDQKKPCHLCLQMEENHSVRRLFVSETGGP